MTMNKEEKINFIKNSNKLCVYSETFVPPFNGIYQIPITKEEALNLINDCDKNVSITELKDKIHIVKNTLF